MALHTQPAMKFLLVASAFATFAAAEAGQNVNPEPKKLAPNLYDQGISYTPSSKYPPYQSQWSNTTDATSWIQIDLGGHTKPINEIILYPLPQPHDYYEQPIVSYGFPIRYKIETSDDEDFINGSASILVDRTAQDQPNPRDTVVKHHLGKPAELGRYLRLTGVKLGPTNRDGAFMLGMMKIEAMAGSEDVALLKSVSVDPVFGYPGRQTIGQSLLSDLPITDTASITRALRPMGEGTRVNNPQNIIHKAQWHPPERRASSPKAGVTLSGGGAFLDAFKHNIGYLLNDTLGSLEKLGRDFQVRTGKQEPELDFPAPYWDGYPGSNAARFLMGASNSLRWTDNTELHSRVTSLIDIIEDCAKVDGEVMGFPNNETFEHQNGAYGRAWLTHGLLEAGYLGDERGFHLLRKYYDWFNKYEFLDQMMHGSVQGGQGVVGSTLVGSSPVGVPEDIYVVQQYFQENYWRDGLAEEKADLIYQYPYDHPHTYLTTSLEPYFDMYLLTGDERYYSMVEGYWNLFYKHWINIGGSTSVIEYGEYPPDSQRLNGAGELCGSSFWIRINQRFHWLHPEKEVYMAEIEKSVYNVIMGNQINDTGMVYHAHLTGQKDFHPPWGDALSVNTCCEGQGTRSLGSIPEFIYSTDPDSGELYVNLFQSSEVTWKLKGTDATLKMDTQFPYDGHVILELTHLSTRVQASVHIRVPSWQKKNVYVSVNDKKHYIGEPGSYLAINRSWAQGDKITFTLVPEYELVEYKGQDQIAGHSRYGLMYGPVLMAVTGPDEAAFSLNGTSPEQLFELLQPIEGQPLHSTIKGYPAYTMMPYYQVGYETFTCVPVVDVQSS